MTKFLKKKKKKLNDKVEGLESASMDASGVTASSGCTDVNVEQLNKFLNRRDNLTNSFYT